MVHLDKPQYPVEIRRRALSAQQAEYLADCDIVGIAEFLESFHGYPNDDPGLQEAEMDAFIHDMGEDFQPSDERFVVYLNEEFAFRTREQAYWFFCETYKHTLVRLHITKGD